MATLYVVEPGARVEKEYGRLIVTLEDEIIARVAMNAVSAVVLIGNASVTTQALHALLLQSTPLFLVDRRGQLLGSLAPPLVNKLPVRRAQYASDTDRNFCLEFTKNILKAKINNQYTFARRLARRHRLNRDFELAEMLAAGEAVSDCRDLPAIFGLEGTAARYYFEIYCACFDPSWNFTDRNRRPPKDPINALLSLGYTFLTDAMLAALEVVGVDPYLGYFHEEAPGKPCLALDLIEVFRAPVVDSLVLGLANKGLLNTGDFEESAEGLPLLTHAGMRIFVREFSDKLESEVTWRKIGKPLSYRKLLEVQARQLANVLLSKEREFTPFKAR